MLDRKKQLGQFFTRDARVQQAMCALVGHASGVALEPSAGEGHLADALARARPSLAVEAVELDESLPWEHPQIPLRRGDFFAFADVAGPRFDVIFGNPPYVAWKNCTRATQQAAALTKADYSDKANLYYLFIDRCVDLLKPGGELIFIVPAEWCYATSAEPLRQKLAARGAVTDVVHCGEEKLFDDASVPAIMIFRFVADAAQTAVRYGKGLTAWLTGSRADRTLNTVGGRWTLLDDATAKATTGWGRLGDQFAVRVGLVTGADAVFRLPAGHRVEPSCVQRQVTTSKVPEEFLNANHVARLEDMPAGAAAHLRPHRDRLLARRIARFDETNWWRYGAVRNEAHMAAPTDRFFALVKSRDPQPFFECPQGAYYGGGVLGLFRRPGALDVSTAVLVCNSTVFRSILDGMFLTTADKLSLQPATLEDALFPKDHGQAARALGLESAA